MIALGRIPNKTKVGDMGIDGVVSPAAAAPSKAATPQGKTPAFTECLDHWCLIQFKRTDKVSRPDIDAFEAVMIFEDRSKGFFVPVDLTRDAPCKIDGFFRKSAKAIMGLTAREIWEEVIARKLAPPA